jgi:hypothetical protein
MDEQLQQLIELQKEQNQLLRKHLWRLRFSLMTLLLLTTATAVGLGIVAYQTRQKVFTPANTPPFGPTLRIQSAPAGDIKIDPDIPNTSLVAPATMRIQLV